MLVQQWEEGEEIASHITSKPELIRLGHQEDVVDVRGQELKVYFQVSGKSNGVDKRKFRFQHTEFKVGSTSENVQQAR